MKTINQYITEKKSETFTIKAGGVEFHVSAKSLGQKLPGWKGAKPVNSYDVTVEKDEKKCSFRFYDSIFATESGKGFTEDTAKDALHSVCLDSLTYLDCNGNLKEFMLDMGYDSEDEKEARKILNGCEKNWKKLAELVDEHDLVKIANDLD